MTTHIRGWAPPLQSPPASSPDDAAPAADLVQWSLDGLLALRFPASRSQAYPAAVVTARAATQYAETRIDGTVMHWCGFGRQREQLARALSVVHATHAIKGFELYTSGQLVADWYRVQAVLRCALQASALPDPQAHCVVMVSSNVMGLQLHPEPGMLRFNPSPTVEDIGGILYGRPDAWDQTVEFPCRYLVSQQFRFQPGHPFSEADQLRAGAVRHGCDWCPHLKT